MEIVFRGTIQPGERDVLNYWCMIGLDFRQANQYSALGVDENIFRIKQEQFGLAFSHLEPWLCLA